MLIDARHSPGATAGLTADVVIVGAGTVGLFLAHCLRYANRDLCILLLEAGATATSTEPNAQHARNVGKPHAGVLTGRASGLGGTSSLWGGQLAEFDPGDVDRPDAPWPIGYGELAKYYEVAYARLGMRIPTAVEDIKLRLGGESGVVAGAERFFTRWLEEPNFARKFSAMISRDPGIRVVVNLPVAGIEFNGAVAASVIGQVRDRPAVHVRAPKFVFATGTIATSRFFLTTGRRGRVPWERNDNVGRYFQDHLGARILDVEVANERAFRDHFEDGWVDGIKLQPKLRMSIAGRRQVRSGACGYFSFHSRMSGNIAHLKQVIRSLRAGVSFSTAASLVTDLVSVSRAIVPVASRFVRDRRMLAMMDQGVGLHVQVEQIPLSRSRITLRPEGPAADGLDCVDVDWRCDGGELESIRRIVTDVDTYIRSRGLGMVKLPPSWPAGEPDLMERLQDTYHMCGGMRMSDSDRLGVVDGNSRVWGTSNVWVAGAAVFPSSSHANCTLTALALAARLADTLR